MINSINPQRDAQSSQRHIEIPSQTSWNGYHQEDKRHSAGKNTMTRESLYQRRQWQPTPVLLPDKSHGWRSLVGYIVHGVAKSQTRLSDFTFMHWRRKW